MTQEPPKSEVKPSLLPLVVGCGIGHKFLRILKMRRNETMDSGAMLETGQVPHEQESATAALPLVTTVQTH